MAHLEGCHRPTALEDLDPPLLPLGCVYAGAEVLRGVFGVGLSFGMMDARGSGRMTSKATVQACSAAQ